MKFTTEPITLGEIELGQFEVTFEGHCTVIAKALTPNESSRGYHHPHVNGSHRLCLGHSEALVRYLFHEQHWAELQDTIAAILNTQGPDCFQSIRNWHEEYCDECDCYQYDCECDS